MGEIGNNQEPLTEIANFVYTGSLWVPQKSNNDGETLVNVQNAVSIPDYSRVNRDNLTWYGDRQDANLASNNYLELLTGDTNSSIVNLNGLVIADGKKLCISRLETYIASSSGTVELYLRMDGNTLMSHAYYNTYIVINFNKVFEINCDGSREFKIAVRNTSGGSRTTLIQGLVWVEDQ